VSDAERALAKLRGPGTLEELAAIVVDQTTATPLRDIATPQWIAGQLVAAIEATVRGDMARDWLLARMDVERARWSQDERPVGDLLAEEAQKPLRELLSKPYQPNQELVFAILDQPAFHDLMRVVLSQAITRFRGRLRNVDDGLLGGLGQKAAKRGRGLLGGLRGSLGDVSGVAENLVGAVRDEVETAFEQRVQQYVRGATSDALRNVATWAGDADHTEAMAGLRLGILDVILQRPVSELAAEVEQMGPDVAVDVVIEALRSAVEAPDLVERIEGRVAAALEEAGDGTLGAWLEDVGLAEVWSQSTTELVASRLRAVVDTPRFAAWWRGLFE